MIDVLIVDDSPIMRAVLRKSLGLSGLALGTVHEASDGVEALRVLGSANIGVVFADIHMPNMGGVELVEKMYAEEPLRRVPVVVVSSDASAAHNERLLNCNVKGVLKKPFRPEQIRAVLRSVMKSAGEGGGS